MKGYSAFPNPSALLQFPYQIAKCYMQDTYYGSLTSLQRCSRCILQPQPTWPLVRRVLSLRRDTVGVFYSPSKLGPISLISNAKKVNWITVRYPRLDFKRKKPARNTHQSVYRYLVKLSDPYTKDRPLHKLVRAHQNAFFFKCLKANGLHALFAFLSVSLWYMNTN